MAVQRLREYIMEYLEREEHIAPDVDHDLNKLMATISIMIENCMNSDEIELVVYKDMCTDVADAIFKYMDITATDLYYQKEFIKQDVVDILDETLLQ